MTEQKVKKRGWVKNAAIIFLSVMLVLTFFSNTFMNRSLPEVAVQSVQSGTISARIRGTGAVTANESFEVKSPQTREVLSVPVKVGDKVAVGDILLHYSDADSTQIKEAEAALDALVLAYQTALLDSADLSDYHEEQRTIELAQKALNKAKADREENRVTAQQIADAKAAIKKAATELAAQDDKVAELTEQLGKLTEGQDNSAEIDAKVAEISAAKSSLDTMKNLSYKTGYQNLTNWAENWRSIDANKYTPEHYKTALVQLLAPRINSDGTLLSEPTELAGTRPSGLAYEPAIVKGIVDAYNAIYAQEQKIKLLEAELNSLYVSHGGGSWDYATVKQQLKDAKTKQASLKTVKEEADALLTELEAKKVKFEQADAAVDTNQTALENAMYALEKKQRDSGKQQSKDALTLAAKKKEIDSKKEELESLKGGGEGASVESQVNGVVTEINASAGSVAEKDALLMKVEVPARGYSVSFSVTTKQSKKLIVGDAAEITNYYYGEVPTATLAGIRSDPQNPTTNKILTFKLQGEVESGTQLSVAIGERGGNYETIVPNSAIRTDSNGKFVLAVIAKNGPLGNRYIAQRIEVKVLASDDNSSAVSGALAWNDMVITTSTKPIEPGTQVRLAD